jgi:hypothetical protein
LLFLLVHRGLWWLQQLIHGTSPAGGPGLCPVHAADVGAGCHESRGLQEGSRAAGFSMGARLQGSRAAGFSMGARLQGSRV